MKGKDSPATQSATSQPIMLRGKSHNNISSICSSFLTGYMLNCIFAIGSFNPLGLVWVQGKVKTTKNRFNVCISDGGHVNFYHMTWNVFLLCFLIFFFLCLSALWFFFWSMLLSLGHEKNKFIANKTGLTVQWRHVACLHEFQSQLQICSYFELSEHSRMKNCLHWVYEHHM